MFEGNCCRYCVNKLDFHRTKKNPANLIVFNIVVFFFYAEHYNSSTPTSYRAHSLGLTSNKNNTDATFGLYPFLTCTNKPESTTQRFTVHQYKEATSVHQLVAPTQQGVVVATTKKKFTGTIKWKSRLFFLTSIIISDHLWIF